MDFLKSPVLKEWLQKRYLDERNLERLKEKYNQAPFPHIVLKDFLRKEKIDAVLTELAKEEFIEKESDLFKFMQTDDLEESSNPTVKELRGILGSKPFVSFIEYLSGCSLKPHKIDMHATLYQNTDFLLCHDDQLEGRKIAYLLYFSDFRKKEGGSLKLYASRNGKPGIVAKKISPSKNSFVIFTVSKDSFHAIDEVIVNKQRITIGGWFHGR